MTELMLFFAVVLVGACSPARERRSVPIVATDYAYRVPDTLDAGPVAFSFDNQGRVAHEVVIGPLRPGASPAQVRDLLPGAAMRLIPHSRSGVRSTPDRLECRQVSEGNMATEGKGIPQGASVIIPRLVCRDPAVAIEFCASTFGAVERVRRPGPDGTVAHALMTIGPAMIMIEREWPTLTSRAPKPDGSSPVVMYVYVEEVDQTVERAIAGGAHVLIPPQDQFWGDRTAWIMDPCGHVWTIATRIEETSDQERKDRWSSMLRTGR